MNSELCNMGLGGTTPTTLYNVCQQLLSRYRFELTLPDTNGAYGPVVIHGPSSANYDHELEPLLISDWYHADAFSMFHEEITDHAHIPTGTLMNGKGVFDCDPKDDARCTGKEERHEIFFEPGKKHKLRLVNSGSLATYKFWMDGHNFTVVANDFVPIEPYVTDVLIVGIGMSPILQILHIEENFLI